MSKTIEQLIESLDTIPFVCLLVQDYQEDIIIYLIG